MEWKWEPVVLNERERPKEVPSGTFRQAQGRPEANARNEAEGKKFAQPEKEAKKVELLRDEWYDCAFCGGTGEKPRGSVCSVCRGSKRIQLTPPVVKCASCKGRGEERPRSNITCTPCRGKGYVSVTEPVEICPTCKGIGRPRGLSLSCVQCKGIGVVAAR